MKVVINACFGGYGLSYKAMMRYAELSGFTLYAAVDKRDADGRLNFRDRCRFVEYDGEGDAFIIYYYKQPVNHDGSVVDDSYFSDDNIERNDPNLVRVVEELGDDANGSHAKLRVVEIPDGIEWGIHEYDGSEHVEEKHRTWR